MARHGQVIAIKLLIVQKEIHHEGDIIRTESTVREVLGKGMKKELQAMHGYV